MYKISSTIIIFLIFLTASAVAAKSTDTIPFFLKKYKKIYKKSPRQASLAWFEDARLGMFIHWGVWGKYHSAWAMYNLRIPFEEYSKTACETDPSGFDAEEIVKLAAESGMRYITFVARHHDGFCLWNSKFTDFDSKDFPMNRDLLKELSDACHKHKMPLYIYYSLGIDWVFPYFLPRDLYKSARPDYAVTPGYYKYRTTSDFEKYRTYCKQQLTELCTNYGPVAGFWFDPLGGVLANSMLFKTGDFYDLIHRYQPHALIHFKTGITGTEDVLVGERELRSISSFYSGKNPSDRRIASLADSAWQMNYTKKAEIAVTSQGTWEWTPKSRCADVTALWKMLVDASENNANLLLNFGPEPDGSIPPDVLTNFRKLGERIRKEGYPQLNKTTWLKLRQQGTTIDKTEKYKTDR